MPELDPAGWDAFLSQYPDHHLLQTTAWGQLKASFGWKVIRILSGKDGSKANGAQLLVRPLSLGLSFAYIPRGPLGETGEDLWAEVDAACRRHGAIFLKVEPDLWFPAGQEEKPSNDSMLYPPPGFHRGSQAIQPQQTLIIDLSGDEDYVLGRMKQKTRYNIRLAQKKEVKVQPSEDIETFHNLLKVTGARDKFAVHALEYYQLAYDLFYPRGNCELLMAEYEGEPIGGLMVFCQGKRAWYLYGASANDHRDRMPAYLLQWEAMRWARSQGCVEYDLWGVPDADETTLEGEFTRYKKGLWGVYRFKRGFGGVLRRSAGPWDRVYRPSFYTLYKLWGRLGNG